MAGPVAWMAMMGFDSVDYHEHSVAGRSDDPVAAAAAYYASRGETPMVWGGSGVSLLGLDGQVDLEDYRTVFGEGGAHDPRDGRRLVACRRPGLELVVAPHKSIAELGVIGRAEDMHAIVDAERDATLAHLDGLVRDRGGRRGRAQTVTPTGGLVWATSRHATTRAGDPQVHDHVLIANAVLMGDERGGWKGLDTAFLRDHLHAATAVGRIAAAGKAVELGYGIVPVVGRSGRLGGWAIAGIPEQVCELHSTRSAQITEAAGTDASYQARSVAARATRDRKAEVPVADLMAGWRAQLTAAGYPPAGLVSAVTAAGISYRQEVADLEVLAGELLGPGGRLAQEKTFTRGDVIIAAAPHLHGLPVESLDRMVATVLAHPDAVALPPVGGAREQVWAAACVLADEERIAGLAQSLAEGSGPVVTGQTAGDAVAGLERRLGGGLNETQRQVAVGLMTGGHRLDVVVGVAGSGKTTTLAAVRAGFETAGYTVIGTATSGQAAKTLGAGAGMESRTVASLSWRLDHGTLTLTDRHVLIVDESAMTADVDIARLLTAAERAGSKVVLVGDDRQLGAIGPGGALRALTERHPDRCWTLTDNLRQRDPGERAALAHLRDGQINTAVAWYAHQGRIHPVRKRHHAVKAMVRAWAIDTAEGRDTLMVAYRRDNVDDLNQTARALFEQAGMLTGPELVTPDGQAYRAGDRVITLAPGPHAAWVTSQTAEVTSVDPDTQTIQARTPDGQTLHMGPEETGADRLAHGYAITAHRAQGATIDTTHVLNDGGGRELVYVAMSRARGESHVYVTAADLPDAADRVAWAWDDQRRQQWTTDQHRLAEHLQAMRAERDQLRAGIPPEVPAGQLDQIRHQKSLLDRDLIDLQAGTGRWADTQVGWAHLDLLQARTGHDRAVHQAQGPRQGPLARRRNQQTLESATTDLEGAEQRWEQTIRPHTDQLHVERTHLAERHDQLEAAGRARAGYLETHPEVIARLGELNRAIDHLRTTERRQGRTGQSAGPPRPDRARRPAPTLPGAPTWTEPAQAAGPDL